MQKRVNLVPQKPLSEKIKGIIPVLLLSLALLLVIFFVLRVNAINRQLQQVTARITAAEQQANDMRQLKEKIQATETLLTKSHKEKTSRTKRVTTLSRSQSNKHHFARPLAFISQTLPSTIRCQAINFHGNHGAMTGTALDYDDLTEVVQTMHNAPLFSQVSLTVTDRDNSQDLERITFTITMTIKEDKKG